MGVLSHCQYALASLRGSLSGGFLNALVLELYTLYICLYLGHSSFVRLMSAVHAEKLPEVVPNSAEHAL
jgi:hypothetical protein